MCKLTHQIAYTLTIEKAEGLTHPSAYLFYFS